MWTAEDAVCIRVRQHFDEATRLAQCARASVSHEGKLSRFILNSRCFQFLFGFAYPGNFG